MASRILASTLRPSLRSSSLRYAGHRTMSSAAPHAAPKSDKPWIIGSALFFIPLFAYIVSPTGRGVDKTHGHDHHHEHGHGNVVPPVTMKDDEGTEAEITASLATSEATDAPQSGGAEPPAVDDSSSNTVEDDEGTPADVTEFVEESTSEDTPRHAAETEEKAAGSQEDTARKIQG